MNSKSTFKPFKTRETLPCKWHIPSQTVLLFCEIGDDSIFIDASGYGVNRNVISEVNKSKSQVFHW